MNQEHKQIVIHDNINKGRISIQLFDHIRFPNISSVYVLTIDGGIHRDNK